ncbi:MAG: ABC transporter ATP-binding protein, partial [Ginsengibacter sp.]
INHVKVKFNTTSIIITHDLTCAKTTGDRVAMLFDGKFLKQGTFDEVFATDDEQIQNFYKYNFIN